MDTKLTLKLDKGVIEKAKSFARKNNTSLSSLVENYFAALSELENDRTVAMTPTVKALAGALKAKGNVDINALKDDYLMSKYVHD